MVNVRNFEFKTGKNVFNRQNLHLVDNFVNLFLSEC